MPMFNSPVDYREQINVTAPRLPYEAPPMDPNDLSNTPVTHLPYYPDDMATTQGGSIDDPRWYDGTWGTGGGIPDWLKDIGGGIKDFIDPNGQGNWMERAALAGTALNQYNNAGKYMDMAGKYAHEMNPFDLAQRQYYQGKLRSSYDDPTAFLNDPGHKAGQQKRLNQLQARLGAQGYMGSGREMLDMADYISSSDAEYLQKEREQLGGLAGSSIGPGAAAGLIQTGITGSIKSQNDALAAMTQALSPRDSGQGGGGARDGRTTTGGGADLNKWIQKGAGWAKTLAQGGAIPWKELARLGKLDLYDPEYQAFIKAQGDMEMDVTRGNQGGQWDEFGTENPDWVPGPQDYSPPSFDPNDMSGFNDYEWLSGGFDK